MHSWICTGEMPENNVQFCLISLEILTILLMQLCEQNLWQSSSGCLAVDSRAFRLELEINLKLFSK